MKSDETNGMENAALDALVRRAREGNAEALGDLYRQLRPRVFGLCRHLLGSREAAEDAASEVFLKAQRAMKTYDSALPFPRWLLSIAGHYCIDVLRRRRLEQRLFHPGEIESEQISADRLSPLAEVMQAEQRDHVRTAVEGLPERYRLPLVLRYYSELSYEQIAGTLGLNRNHVATLIFRAKQELRRSLERQAVGLAKEPVQ